jgi:transcriptional regulator with XRE-family HTH domain
MASRKPVSRSKTPRSSRWLWANDYKQFRRRLVEARHSANLTQREAAKLLGRSNTYVADSETGERRVDAVELARFAAIYRKPLTFFFPFFKG